MRRTDVRIAGQVGDGSGDLEDAVVGPGAESQLGHGHLEKLFSLGADGALTLDVLRAHLGVGIDLSAFEPPELDLPGARHDVFEFDLRHFDLDVDPVEKRSGDF